LVRSGLADRLDRLKERGIAERYPYHSRDRIDAETVSGGSGEENGGERIKERTGPLDPFQKGLRRDLLICGQKEGGKKKNMEGKRGKKRAGDAKFQK